MNETAITDGRRKQEEWKFEKAHNKNVQSPIIFNVNIEEALKKVREDLKVGVVTDRYAQIC